MTRFRKSQIEERSRNINRLQKYLEGANVKLGSWLSVRIIPVLGAFTPSQRECISHIMEIIRNQTAQIEKTDAMIQRGLSNNYQAAVKALDVIPGIGRGSAEQIFAEIGVDMGHFRNQHALSK